MRQRLSDKEKAEIKGGEAITLAAVLAIRTIGVRAVVTYKLFFSKEGKSVLPGRASFSWEYKKSFLGESSFLEKRQGKKESLP